MTKEENDIWVTTTLKVTRTVTGEITAIQRRTRYFAKTPDYPGLTYDHHEEDGAEWAVSERFRAYDVYSLTPSDWRWWRWCGDHYGWVPYPVMPSDIEEFLRRDSTQPMRIATIWGPAIVPHDDNE